MTIYYVGTGGNDGNAGTSWALRKLTLNGAEDIPVAANDTVYVGAGTYRETLTVDVSGSVGQPITYIGDYSGVNTDGVGGVVRVTGSDNDQTATRANAISASGKNYRTFQGFLFDTTTSYLISATGGPTNWIINQCRFESNVVTPILIDGAGQSTNAITNCKFFGGKDRAIRFNHSSVVDNTANAVSNCIFLGPGPTVGVSSDRIGGITIKNSIFMGLGGGACRVVTALNAGQVMTVNNCTIVSCLTGLQATTTAEFSENYNDIWQNGTDRINVITGANSLSYPPLFDARWFFELVSGLGQMLSPFDLASYSQLVNVAGTSPTTTDMRGTSVIGAQREWGALEYNLALLIRRVIARQV